MSDLTSWIGIKQRPPDCRLTPNPYHPLRKGLVFLGGTRWPGSRRYDDASGHGNHGTLTNMAIPAAEDGTSGWGWSSELGRAYTAHDGINDNIVIPVGGSGNALPCTMAGWFNASSSGDYRPILVCRNYGLQGLATSGAAGGPLTFYWDADEYSLSTGLTFSTKAWHFGAAVVRVGFVEVYLNNTVYTNTDPNTDRPINGTWNSGVDSVSGRQWAGFLSDRFIWKNRALSPSEISALADPSNVMLSGLLLPPRRVLFSSAAAPPATNRRRRFLISCAGT